MIEKMILGSAQFGLDYGISNVTGITSLEEVDKILHYANDLGICHIDTAPAYGHSEQLIGSLEISKKFLITTKIAHLNTDRISEKHYDLILKTVDQSILNLKQSPHIILLHNSGDITLEGSKYLFKAFDQLKGFLGVQKIGVSVYDTDQCVLALDSYDFDVVQVPANIYDRRFVSAEFLSHIHSKCSEVQVRSIFLQGLFFIKKLPIYLSHYQAVHDKFHDFLKNNQLSPLDASVQFIKTLDVDGFLVGVNNLDQLKEVVESVSSENLDVDLRSFNYDQYENLIDPRTWRKND